MKVLAPAFTKPGFCNALLVICGWLLVRGRHAVTQALVELGVDEDVDHERLHRFFSRGAWSPDRIGQLLFDKISEHFESSSPITLVVDDTLVSHRGPMIFGTASHIDAVRSTRRRRAFSFGHVWVVLAVAVRVPFSSRTWALPILFRLYRPKTKTKSKGGDPTFKKKTELARDMLKIVAQWAPGTRFRVVGDSAYSNATVLRELPDSMTFIGSMRDDAVLTTVPTRDKQPATGRRRIRGDLLPKPRALVKSARQRWCKVPVHIYGQDAELEYKHLTAQWYRGAGKRPLHIVLVRVTRGDVAVRVFFSTDPELSVAEIIATYAARWGIEVAFREMKQELGFGDSAARTREAVHRVAPLAGYLYTMLVLWFVVMPDKQRAKAQRRWHWYPNKRGHAFSDILNAARRQVARVRVFDLLRDSADLREPHRGPPREAATRLLPP